MVLYKKTKKYLRKVFSTKGLPSELVNEIFSYDTKIQDILPDWVYDLHTFVSYDVEFKGWIGVNELKSEDYDSEDTYMTFLTYYFVEPKVPDHQNKQQYRSDNEEIIDVEEGNICIWAKKESRIHYSTKSWVEGGDKEWWESL